MEKKPLKKPFQRFKASPKEESLGPKEFPPLSQEAELKDKVDKKRRKRREKKKEKKLKEKEDKPEEVCEQHNIKKEKGPFISRLNLPLIDISAQLKALNLENPLKKAPHEIYQKKKETRLKRAIKEFNKQKEEMEELEKEIKENKDINEENEDSLDSLDDEEKKEIAPILLMPKEEKALESSDNFKSLVYPTNPPSDSLDRLSLALINRLSYRYQYKKRISPLKAKKRFITGLNEIFRHLGGKKALEGTLKPPQTSDPSKKALFLAGDLQLPCALPPSNPSPHPLSSLLSDILSLCVSQRVRVHTVASRDELGVCVYGGERGRYRNRVGGVLIIDMEGYREEYTLIQGEG